MDTKGRLPGRQEAFVGKWFSGGTERLDAKNWFAK